MSKFLCSSSALLRQLKQVAHVVRRNPILPVLSNALFAVTGNELRIVGSDLENTVAVSLPIEGISGDTWAICPPLKALVDVLSNLPDQPITVETGPKENQLSIRATSAATAEEGGTVYGGACYTFGCEPGGNFPKTPAVRDEVQIVLPGHLLRTALAYTSEFICTDMLRPAMACVHLVASSNSARFEATDGFSLAQYTVQASKEPGYGFTGVATKSLLIPKAALAALKALVKNEDVVTITTQADWSHARFQAATWGPEVTVRLVDEKFPSVDKVIPAAFPGGVLTLSRPSAQAMLRRLRPFVNATTKKVHLHLSGAGGFAQAADLDYETEAREPLPGTLAAGEVSEIAFNIERLAHLIGLLPGPRLRIHFTKASSAAVFTSDGYEGLRYLLMPIMITQYA